MTELFPPSPNRLLSSLPEERLESLKAGGIGAIALGGAALLLRGVIPLLPLGAGITPGSAADVATLPLALLGPGAIALLSGFLFGVTYRYIVRQDANSHLQAGAVMAFSLIRGLAQIEPQLATSGLAIAPEQGLVWGVILLQNGAMFAIARWVLQQSLQRGWVKPLGDRP